MQNGFLTHLSCKNNTNASKFPIFQEMDLYDRFDILKKNLLKEIFEKCVKPKPGTGITASYFHLVPLINILEKPGEIVRKYFDNFL